MTYNDGWGYFHDENLKLESMIHIYQEEIEHLEAENRKLQDTVLILQSRLSYYKTVVKEEAEK